MSAVYFEYIYLGLDLLIGCSGRSGPSDKGGEGTCRSSRPRDKAGAVSKYFFPALWAPFWSKYKG